MLEIYKEKRDFKKTKEPSGSKSSKDENKLAFVVHKHEASRLHFDLRYELDGVLKSWAVPKGPTTDTKQKHLAVMVEDHPYDYKDFEGTIPKGEYGGGTVMIWDYGTFVPIGSTGDKKKDEKILHELLDKGRFSVIMDGKKMKGEYSLIKLAKAKEDEWMLLKKHDDQADTKYPDEDLSAYSGRTMKEIEVGKPISGHDIFDGIDKKKLKKAEIPKNIKPMLARLVDKPFDNNDWLFEIKWDGYRTIAEKEGNKLKLYSRNLLSFDKKFPEVGETLKKIDHDFVIDGEAVVFGEDGISDFGLLQNYETEKKGTLIYYVFDLIYLDGYELFDLPLLERKKLLERLVSGLSNVRYTEHVEEVGLDFFEAVKANDLEGMIGKKKQSRYTVGTRGTDWVKVKNILEQEAIVCGYTAPRGARVGIGSLILGVYDGGDLVYIGHSGGGFDDRALVETKKKLDEIKIEKCPFKKVPKTNQKPTWVEPVLVGEVKFREWTKDGLLRQPIFLGFREDKKASEVTRETPAQEEKIVEEPLKVEEKKLKLSNLDKIYFPEKKLTKSDILDYYRGISDKLLPYLKDRPESLKRYPNGIHGEPFFHKNFEKGALPDWVETCEVFSEGEERTMNYMLANDVESLLYMVNLGCIDINPWSSRKGSLDFPDYIIFDLDPEDISFGQVVKAANATYEVLEKAGIHSFCKTSGSTGMHILVPTGAKYTYDQVTDFAKLINIFVQKLLPATTSLERSPKNRQKKVYLDYLQNRRGQTIASIYSIRTNKEAMVSTPLNWKEVNKDLSPLEFTIDTINDRLSKIGDVWEGFFDADLDMVEAIGRIDEMMKSDL